MALQPFIIRSQAGIKRDGTIFDGNFYIDGQWVRFQRKLPRKIGGYTTTNRFLPEICRGLKTYTVGNYTYIFTGSASKLQYHTLDLDGNSSILIDRTPNSIDTSDYNLWQFEIIVDTTLVPPVNQIVAHVSPNAQSLSNTEGGQLFIGNLIDETPLTEFTEVILSEFVQPTGGIVALHPYLVVYGNDGTVGWSAPGRPQVFYPFEYEATAFTLANPIYIGEKNAYTLGTATILNDISVTFGSINELPYNVLTVNSGAYTLLTLSSPVGTSYSSTSNTIYRSATTSLTIQSAISTGGTNFTVASDVRATLPVGTTFTLGAQFAKIYQVSQVAFASGNTTITITDTFTEGYSAGAIIYKFSNTNLTIPDIIPAQRSSFYVAGNQTSVFTGLPNYISFNNQRTLFIVNTAVSSTVTRLPLLENLKSDYPSGTVIYAEGSSTDTGAGNARIASQKIVKGLPLRGGPGNSPSGIFWSTDAVLRMSYVGGDLIFQFDTISAQSSILSSASVIEHDGIYYWVGTDRFLTFNGVVRELPNDLNINWFFDNLNRSQSQRVFSFKVPRYSEIWWCFPYGNAVECTHAVIYNIRENTWYDTKLPNKGRSAGEFIALFGTPIMAGVDPILIDETTSSYAYRLWSHERGTDEVDGQNVYPVDSYFTTGNFSLISQQQGKLKNVRVAVIEPDFIQSGEMTVQILGSANARASLITGEKKTFPATAFTPSDQVVYFKEERRIMYFKFRSNTIGGNYLMGQIVAHIEETDGTYLGASS